MEIGRLSHVTAHAERFSLILLGATLLGALAAVGVCSAIWAVDLDRKPPKIYDLKIVGETHAGGDMRVREHVQVPDNCIPRVSRKLVGPPDAYSDGKAITQIVTDAAVLADGDILIPLPRDVPPGPWRYEESITTQGCGVLSGVLPPQMNAAQESASGAKQGVVGVPRHDPADETASHEIGDHDA